MAPYSTNKHHWCAYILPYIDQGPLAGQYDFTHDFDKGSINPTLITTNIAVFICPSAPNPAARGNVMVDVNGVTLTAPLGVLDYGSINQVFPDFYLLNAGMVEPADTSGAMQAALQTPLMQINDGTSNTILLAEDAGGPVNFVFGKQVGVPTGGSTNTPGDWGWADSGFPFSINGADPTTGLIVKQSATTGNPSCFINCTNNGEVYSFHTGGANVVMVDGSVHFLVPDMSPNTFAALFTKNGGETVSIEN